MKFLISKLAKVLSIFGSENRHFECFLGIFVIQLTSDGDVYNLVTFCSNKMDNL